MAWTNAFDLNSVKKARIGKDETRQDFIIRSAQQHLVNSHRDKRRAKQYLQSLTGINSTLRNSLETGGADVFDD